MLDLVIKNGLVVDGIRASRRHADVAIAGGKSAAIGKLTDSAIHGINASDWGDAAQQRYTEMLPGPVLRS